MCQMGICRLKYSISENDSDASRLAGWLVGWLIGWLSRLTGIRNIGERGHASSPIRRVVVKMPPAFLPSCVPASLSSCPLVLWSSDPPSYLPISATGSGGRPAWRERERAFMNKGKRGNKSLRADIGEGPPVTDWQSVELSYPCLSMTTMTTTIIMIGNKRNDKQTLGFSRAPSPSWKHEIQ